MGDNLLQTLLNFFGSKESPQKNYYPYTWDDVREMNTRRSYGDEAVDFLRSRRPLINSKPKINPRPGGIPPNEGGIRGDVGGQYRTVADYMDTGPTNPNFKELYKKRDDHLYKEASGEIDDLHKLEAMGTLYPEHKMDLMSIYKFLQRQKLDQEINNSVFGNRMKQNDLYRMQEPRNLPDGQWDYSPWFNMSGRRM